MEMAGRRVGVRCGFRVSRRIFIRGNGVFNDRDIEGEEMRGIQCALAGRMAVLKTVKETRSKKSGAEDSRQ